jgi:cytochrome bd-type quinol oxidase subunit 2
MRWKLLLLASVIAAFIAFGLWCAFTVGLYGSARAMARSDFRLLGSAAAPIVMAALASIFVYRHTAKRRKLQAVLSAVLTLMFAVDVYVVAWAFYPDRFYIPKTYEVRHAR